MIRKEILVFGKQAVIACDEICKKAWGVNNRPRVQVDEENYDDYYFVPDGELGVAPEDTGTYEGGCAKPIHKEERLNKWCLRECERCLLSHTNDFNKPIHELDLPDFSKRRYNIER